MEHIKTYDAGLAVGERVGATVGSIVSSLNKRKIGTMSSESCNRSNRNVYSTYSVGLIDGESVGSAVGFEVSVDGFIVGKNEGVAVGSAVTLYVEKRAMLLDRHILIKL